MFACTGYASSSAEVPFSFRRRDPGPSDIPIDQIETAYARRLKSDVKDRFVIDMASLPKAA